MTIDEQLGFSVLSAPVASYDRRALSQAWYSALYGSRGEQSGTAKSAGPQAPTCALSEVQGKSEHHATQSTTDAERAWCNRTQKSNAATRLSSQIADRRLPRSPLAKAIARRFSKQAALPNKAAFAIEGEGGRVQILLRSRGKRVDLVAVCAPRANAQVAAALAQARYSLARSGIRLNAETRAEAGC